MPKKKIYETLKDVWNMGIALVLAISLSGMSIHKFIPLLNNDIIHFSLAIILMFVTLLRLFMYATYTHYELDKLNDYFSNDADALPTIQPKVYLTSIGLAISFAILVYFSDKLIIYTPILVVLDLFDFWGEMQVRSYIKKIIDVELKKKLVNYRKNIIQAVKYFYLETPDIQRGVTAMFIDWFAVTLALVSFYETGFLKNYVMYTGYVVIILNVIINEIILAKWRRTRAKIIKEH